MSAVFSVCQKEDLKEVAEAISSQFSAANIFVFDGEMGAGKTTLVGEVCRQLGVFDFSSPTYAIVNTYLSKKFGELYHFDFYRLKDEQEAVESGLDEMLDSGNICFVEWADRISKLLPPTYVRVGIQVVEDGCRQITIEQIGQ